MKALYVSIFLTIFLNGLLTQCEARTVYINPIPIAKLRNSFDAESSKSSQNDDEPEPRFIFTAGAAGLAGLKGFLLGVKKGTIAGAGAGAGTAGLGILALESLNTSNINWNMFNTSNINWNMFNTSNIDWNLFNPAAVDWQRLTSSFASSMPTVDLSSWLSQYNWTAMTPQIDLSGLTSQINLSNLRPQIDLSSLTNIFNQHGSSSSSSSSTTNATSTQPICIITRGGRQLTPDEREAHKPEVIFAGRQAKQNRWNRNRFRRPVNRNGNSIDNNASENNFNMQNGLNSNNHNKIEDRITLANSQQGTNTATGSSTAAGNGSGTATITQTITKTGTGNKSGTVNCIFLKRSANGRDSGNVRQAKIPPYNFERKNVQKQQRKRLPTSSHQIRKNKLRRRKLKRQRRN